MILSVVCVQIYLLNYFLIYLIVRGVGNIKKKTGHNGNMKEIGYNSYLTYDKKITYGHGTFGRL